MQTLVMVIVIVAVVGLSSYLVAIAWRLWSVRRLGDRVKGHLVLTFDDGPGVRTTSGIREILQREHARATFFVTGFRVDRHPDVVKQTTSEGHELASHSQRHLNAWIHPIGSMSDTWSGLKTVRAYSPGARFFRPPFGKATLWTHLVCLMHGFQVVYWTIDCKDAEKHTIREPEDVVKELLRKGGGVVLLHDLDMSPDEFPDRQEKVIRLCESLIQSARAHGMRIATIGELYFTPSLSRPAP